MAVAEGGGRGSATSTTGFPLRWAMLGLLLLLSVIFSEDVMEIRVAAKRLVLGHET